MQYPVAIRQHGAGYQVTIPDIPTLSTTGNTMAEAIANARLVVLQYLSTMLQQDQSIAPATPVERHLSNPMYAGVTWAIVHIDLARLAGDTREVTLQLPMRLLSQLTERYAEQPLDTLVIEALKQFLGHPPTTVPKATP